MANVYAVNYTKAYTTMSGSRFMNMVDADGKPMFVRDKYEASAAAKGTVIYLAKSPGKGYCAGGYLYHDALGADSALAVGTVSDPDKFAASTATTSAGKIWLGAVDLATINAGEDIVATVSGTGAATGTIELGMFIAV